MIVVITYFLTLQGKLLICPDELVCITIIYVEPTQKLGQIANYF